MFIRKKPNPSGSTSVQLIQKIKGKYKVVKTIGCATTLREIETLEHIARQDIELLTAQTELFYSKEDTLIENLVASISNDDIQTLGPELVFGRIYDSIGFDAIKEEMFRHLVIARLAYPLSKLKTVDYLYRYQRVLLDSDAIYRFLDKLSSKLKPQIEQIAFKNTMKVLRGKVNIVFYDMTTLYFEASDEDDLRKTGFSKDGKHQNPQVFIGLLVGLNGYPIGYDIFKGNTFEGHTLIPFIEKMAKKFNLGKPVVVADAGLLSKSNIEALENKGYEYILGARLKNETDQLKLQILESKFEDATIQSFKRKDKSRLIVHYASSRAKKDEYNRKRGLRRLEKRIKAGRLTKSSINNRGYNKYLKLSGEVSIEIDYDKFEKDDQWDGLKGYISNTKMTNQQVLDNYKHLWQIEKAFRMSKTDLRIRPVYHRLQNRIEAHICIVFTAYSIYKELERALYEANSTLSLKKAAEITHRIYQITYTLPSAKQRKSRLLKMDKSQAELVRIINEKF
ncbi:MAG: IS1634 family transposase [Bacteroidota bacterium]|nr:IS1634 family transposase [Bacteroidota bacterium]